MKDKDVKKIIILIIICMISYLLCSNIKFVISILDKIFNAILPFILGIVIAFILNILMVKIEKLFIKLSKNKIKKSTNRVISITLSLIVFIIFIVFISIEIIPNIISSLESIINNIPNVLCSSKDYILNKFSNYPVVQNKIIDLFNDTNNINSVIVNILNYIVNSSISIISNVISSLIILFTSIIFAIYMLSQKEHLIYNLKKLLKAYCSDKVYNKLLEISKVSVTTFSNFISGQCLEALILGTIFFIVLVIFRFPYALLISVFTCITALIPIFGDLIAIIVGAILIAFVSPYKALLFVIIFLIIQQIEGNIIYPKVVGKKVGLSPIWTLLAVTLGGSLFGIPGMLIGLPVASILYGILKKDVNSRLN